MRELIWKRRSDMFDWQLEDKEIDHLCFLIRESNNYEEKRVIKENLRAAIRTKKKRLNLCSEK